MTARPTFAPMPKPLPILFVLLALATGTAQAQDDLYSGTVPVASQAAQEREQRLPEALAQVLRKHSGLYELPADPAVDAALAGAPGLLLAFQYLEDERLRPDGSEETVLLLQGQFQPAAVDRMVRELGLPRWRSEREPVVMWVVVDDGRGRMLTPIEYRYAWQHMERVARDRGLPVSWPGLSEELVEQVDLQLLWGGYTEQLLAEGAATDGVVVAAASREGPTWRVRWTFADTSTDSGWQTESTALETAMAEGMNQLANLVASMHSIGPAGQGAWQVELLIEGLRNSGDYVRTLNYLQGLSLVDAVDVLGAGQDGIRFRVAINAEPAWLDRVLEQDGVLATGGRSGSWRLVP